MVIDIELTLNRFGFKRLAPNKIQLACFRFAKWQIPGKHSISFEINWRKEDKKDREEIETEKLRNATLVFLVKRVGGKINQICLAMKKKGFGMGRWNGTGGKVENETIEDASKREAREEIGVELGQIQKVAELSFFFPHNPSWDQKVHVYLSENWKGEPSESAEMRPQWFDSSVLPYDSMWPDDIFWLPQVLAGNFVKARFVFGEGDTIKEKEVKTVDKI